MTDLSRADLKMLVAAVRHYLSVHDYIKQPVPPALRRLPEHLEALSASGQEPDGVSQQWITTTEAAKRTGVSARTVRRQCQTGRIKAQRAGRDWQIPADAVQEDS